MVSPELQASFDLSFPKHAGHFIEKINNITDLSVPFTCFCGEIIRVTCSQQLEAIKDSRKLIMDYLDSLYEEKNSRYNRLAAEAIELGYVLYPITELSKLVQKRRRR